MDKEPFMSDYYCHKHHLIPLRWLPHEAVFEDEYSTKSDVWMFACTVWELHHAAEKPFSCQTDETVLKDLSTKVLNWSSSFVESEPLFSALLTKCWSHDPAARPSFQQLLQCVESLGGTDSNKTD